MQPGERVVVSGPGPIGLLTTNVAKLDGASHITVIGAPVDERERLPKAREMGDYQRWQHMRAAVARDPQNSRDEQDKETHR